MYLGLAAKRSAVKISCTIARTTGNVSGARRAAHPLALDIGVSDRRQDHMMLPAGIAAAFEVVEPQFALEFLILLLDGPALMRQSDQRCAAMPRAADERSST